MCACCGIGVGLSLVLLFLFPQEHSRLNPVQQVLSSQPYHSLSNVVSFFCFVFCWSMLCARFILQLNAVAVLSSIKKNTCIFV